MRKEVEEKIFQSVPVEAFLLTSPANMRYVAGFTGEGYVYCSKEEKIIVTDSRYTLAAKAQCKDFSVMKWDARGYYAILADLLNKEKDIRSLGVEEEHLTVSQCRKLKKQLSEAGCDVAEFVEAGDAIRTMRQIKTSEELAILRRAEAIGDRAFARTLPHLRAGMTEKQVAALLEYYMKEEGADGFSFETIAASGENSAMPHAHPTERLLSPGDFLTMDFGCLYQGYCSDMTRTIVIGKASEQQKKIYETVLCAQETALQGIRPGMTGIEIDALARDVISDAGFGHCFGHSLGHSVGLEIHESPNFSMRDETVICPGMVLSVEPGIYVEGVGGVRIEDVVIITESGCENITHSPKQLLEKEG